MNYFTAGTRATSSQKRPVRLMCSWQQGTALASVVARLKPSRLSSRFAATGRHCFHNL
jgi:hypothetical protein